VANLTFSFAKQDTVIDAGMYDGSLGIISAISALKVLKVTGKLQRLTRPVEVREFSSISSTVVLLLLYHILICLLAPLLPVRGTEGLYYIIITFTRGIMGHMGLVDTTFICIDLGFVLCLHTI